MPGRTRALSWGVIALAVILAENHADARGPDQAPAQCPNAPRVRTDDAVISLLIERAMEHSPTFRSLRESIQTTDGLVYIQRGRCGRNVKACLPYSMTLAGPNRVLRVLLEEPVHEDERTMALIAHELRHALEVLEEPGVRSGPEMYFFFQRNRSLTGATFETPAAMDTEDKVYRELMQSARRNQ